jgi:hypothetical protein
LGQIQRFDQPLIQGLEAAGSVGQVLVPPSLELGRQAEPLGASRLLLARQQALDPPHQGDSVRRVVIVRSDPVGKGGQWWLGLNSHRYSAEKRNFSGKDFL